MPEKIYGIYLTELTFFKFIWYLILRRQICILGTYSYIQNHGGIFEQVVSKLHTRGMVKTIDDFKHLLPYKDSGDFQRLTNAFSESEPWMEIQFNFGNLRGSYALACKHIISNRSYALYLRNYDLFYLAGTLTFPALDSYDRSFFQYRFNKSTPGNIFEPLTKYFLNITLLILSFIQAFIWITSRVRFGIKKHKITLATDYNGGPRDMKFWDYLSSDRNNTLIVVRNKETFRSFAHLLTGYNVVLDNTGVFSPKDAIVSLVKLVQDGFSLFLSYHQVPPDYYRQICFLPFKRMKYRAFFNKYECSFFWGRDDYNYQHIMRSQEIRRAGGVSMGCNHGIQSIVTSAYQLRYLDFDYYYMHGLDQYTNVYSKYWPEHMIARGVGSMFSSPEQQAVIKETNGTDVAIIIAPSFHQGLIYDAILQLATLFSDLKFWIVTKPKHRTEGEFGMRYQNLIQSGLSNVRESVEDVYDLLPRCKYVFSESSTLLAEAVYFDRIALCFDPDPSFKFLYYRKFPELVFKDVDTLARRINETRNIAVRYTDPNLKNLIFKGSEHPWDIIKKDLLIES